LRLRKTDQATPSSGASAKQRRHPLALGIERIGLVSLRFPLAVALVAVALAIAAGFGVTRLKIDDSLSQLFRSDTPEFKQYEEVTRRFPSSEFDVLVVIEGMKLLERESVEKLRDLVTDLQLIDGTRGIISIFSARQPPENGAIPAPLFADQLPEGAAYDALIRRVMGNEIIRGKLLSNDGELTLVVLALDPSVVESSRLRDVVGEIRTRMAEDLAGAGLKAELSGVPVMQLEIRNAVERDRLVYNTIGFVAGCLIAILFFRRISFMIIAAGPPLIAILLALGTLGWLDFRLNMFLNVMTPLIMVISFSDSMQLTFATRDRLLAGERKFEALHNAILIVGPACVLTHATAALSFVALQFSSSDLIRSFGEAGFIATIIALAAVLVLMPLLGVLLLRDESAFAAQIARSDFGVEALRRFCGFVAARMVRRPGLYSLAGVLVVAGLGLSFASLEPRYRLADQVPDKQQAVAASNRLDAKLTGANPIDVLIEFPRGASLYAPETLEVIAKVHAILEKQAGVGNVWSIETLRRWLIEAGKPGAGILQQYVDMLPDHLTRRFISAGQDAVVVSGRIPDIDACRLLPIIDALDNSLGGPRKLPWLQDLGDGSFGNSRAKQRQYDREIEPRLDDRVRVRRRIHRRRLPFIRCHAGEHPSGNFPGRCLWRLTPRDGAGPAVRKRRGADRFVRTGVERNNTFSQPFAPGGRPRPGPRNRCRAGNYPRRPRPHSNFGGACLRAGGDGLFRPAVAAPLRMAGRIRDDGGPDRRSLYFAANGHVPA